MADYTFGYSDGTVTGVGNGWISQTTISLGSNEYPTSFTGRSPGTGGWGPWQLTISDDNGGYFVVKVGVRKNGAWTIGPYDILRLGDYYGNRFPKGSTSIDDYGASWASIALTDSQKLSLAGQTLSFQATYGNYSSDPNIPSSESSFGVPFGFSYATAATPSYKVTAQQVGSGTISTSATTAKAGTTVTVTVSPDNGYFLTKISASTSSGNITLTEQSSTQYTFTMPSANVTVSATFEQHVLTWEEPYSLNISQNENTITATFKGHAKDTASHTIRYGLIGNQKNPDTSSGAHGYIDIFGNASNDDVRILQFSISDEWIGEEWEFYVSATCKGGTTIYTDKISVLIGDAHKTVKYLINNSWVECIPYYYTGTGWEEVEPYYFKDGAWIPCSHT